MIRFGIPTLVALVLVSGSSLRADDVTENIENGTQALHAEDYDKAIDLFSQVLQVDPTNVYALVCRGIAYEHTMPLDSRPGLHPVSLAPCTGWPSWRGRPRK